jgi:hypothetical protein
METYEIPFDPDEITEPHTLRAIIEIGRGPRPSGFITPEHAGSYGAVIWGRGETFRIWGAGYANSDDVLRAYAVKSILSRYRKEARLIVYTRGLRDQLGHVARSNGLKADGGPFVGYEVLKPIQEAEERGGWKLIPYKKGSAPRGVHVAHAVAEDALETALLLRPVFSHYANDHPHHHIIADERNPDPDGIVSGLQERE